MHLCVIHPDGSIKHYAPATIERWYRNYKNSGFDSLIPSGREDQGIPRKLDYELQEQIKYLKTNYPRMSASAIYRQLHENGSIKKGDVSESTVNRYINLNEIDLNNQTALSILTAASKAIAYEEDTVNIDLMIDAAIRYLQDTNTMLKEM